MDKTVVDSGGVSLTGLLVGEIILNIAPLISVAVRLVANLRLHGRLFIDDYISILAVALLATLSGLYYPTITWLKNPPENMLLYLRVATATYFISAYGNFSAKIPLLIIYVRLFGTKAWVKRTVYTIFVVGSLGYTATSIAGTLTNPENKVLDEAWWSLFLERSYGVAVANAVLNLAIDVIAFIIPIPIVYNLQMPVRKKLGLGFMFVIGLVALTGGAVSLHYRRSSSAKTVVDLTIVSVITILDSALSIILGCSPAIWSLSVKVRGNRGVPRIKKLRSLFSSDTSGDTKQTLHSTDIHGANSKGQSNTYIELERGASARGPSHENEP